MSVETISLMLAAGALLAVAVSLVVLAGAGTPGAHGLRAGLDRYGHWGAFAVAAVAMAGSLYYSEIAGFVPCEFCWYQRIAMYPLAAILLVAAITRDRTALWYVVPIAAIGLLLSIYHYQLQLFPDQGSTCTSGAPCTARYVEQLRFVSIPFMAGSGFLAILALQFAQFRAARFGGRGGRAA